MQPVNSTMSQVLESYLWRRGGRADLFIKHTKLIGATIKEFKLEALDEQHLGIMKAETKAPEILDRRWWRGGIRVPHLHWKGDIYVLDEKQWSAFSGKLVKEYQEKLAKVSTVSFDQLIELSEAIDTL